MFRLQFEDQSVSLDRFSNRRSATKAGKDLNVKCKIVREDEIAPVPSQTIAQDPEETIAPDQTIAPVPAPPINACLTVASFMSIDEIPVSFHGGRFWVLGTPIATYNSKTGSVDLLPYKDKLQRLQYQLVAKLPSLIEKEIMRRTIEELVNLGIVSPEDREIARVRQFRMIEDQALKRAFKERVTPKKTVSLQERLDREDAKRATRAANRKAAIDVLNDIFG